MLYQKCLFLYLIGFGISFSDILVADFENDTSINNLGNGIYFFSDATVGGTSGIINSELLPDSTYIDFKPDTGGYHSKFCGKVVFHISPYPPNGMDQSFVAMGMNIGKDKCIIDLSGATGIRFCVRGTPGVYMFFEVVTSIVYDYAYHRAYFELKEVWTEYLLSFSDTAFFKQPDYFDDMTPKAFNLSKVQEINIQVARVKNEKCKYKNEGVDKGFFAVDNIIIVGIDNTVGSRRTLTYHQLPENEVLPMYKLNVYDLLGRTMNRCVSSPTGMYLLKKRQVIIRNITISNR